MIGKNEIINLLKDMRKTHRMQPLGYGRMIEEGFKKVFELLESEPEPTESRLEWFNRCCELQNALGQADKQLKAYEDELAEARKKPEPTELTELARRFLPPEEIFNDIDLYDLSEKPGQLEIIAHNLCNEIDRLTAENKSILKRAEAAESDWQILKEELKAKDDLLSSGLLLNGDGLDALQSMASVKFMVSACSGSLTPTAVAESINGILAKAKEKTEQALTGESDGNSKTNQRI